MKDLLKATVILGLFAFFGIATSKETLDPCEHQVQSYLRDEAEVYGYYSGSLGDTSVITLTLDSSRDSMWDIQTEQVCRIMRDSCHLNGRKVLVARWMDDPARRETPYGKTIYYRICP